MHGWLNCYINDDNRSVKSEYVKSVLELNNLSYYWISIHMNYVEKGRVHVLFCKFDNKSRINYKVHVFNINDFNVRSNSPLK